MPILKGAMSFTRFRITNEAQISPEQIAERINLFRFRPLHPRAEDTETVGFCPFLAEYDDEKIIETRDFLYDDNIVLCLRIDTLTLPKDLLKFMVKKSLQAYQRDHQRLPDRRVKKEIELAEAQSLRARVLPKTKIVESVWCQKTGELRVFSRAPNMIDRFIDIFQNTFTTKPERRDFPAEALRFSEVTHRKQALLTMIHLPLYAAPIRIEIQ